jgi:hypothetical protein
MQDRPYSLDRARAFIASVEWVFAKTMAHHNPHEYVVERVAGGEEFSAFVDFVRSGPIRRYKRCFCQTVDEHDFFLTHAGADGWIGTASRATGPAGTSSRRRPAIGARSSSRRRALAHQPRAGRRAAPPPRRGAALVVASAMDEDAKSWAAALPLRPRVARPTWTFTLRVYAALASRA